MKGAHKLIGDCLERLGSSRVTQYHPYTNPLAGVTEADGATATVLPQFV